jgi:hypothetical protein
MCHLPEEVIHCQCLLCATGPTAWPLLTICTVCQRLPSQHAAQQASALHEDSTAKHRHDQETHMPCRRGCQHGSLCATGCLRCCAECWDRVLMSSCCNLGARCMQCPAKHRSLLQHKRHVYLDVVSFLFVGLAATFVAFQNQACTARTAAAG